EHCWSPSKISREDVKAELRRAQTSGELRTVGELSGGSDSLTTKVDNHSVVTREEVRRELLDAQRQGNVEVGDLGRTQAELHPRRYAAKKGEASGAVASTR